MLQTPDVQPECLETRAPRLIMPSFFHKFHICISSLQKGGMGNGNLPFNMLPHASHGQLCTHRTLDWTWNIARDHFLSTHSQGLQNTFTWREVTQSSFCIKRWLWNRYDHLEAASSAIDMENVHRTPSRPGLGHRSTHTHTHSRNCLNRQLQVFCDAYHALQNHLLAAWVTLSRLEGAGLRFEGEGIHLCAGVSWNPDLGKIICTLSSSSLALQIRKNMSSAWLQVNSKTPHRNNDLCSSDHYSQVLASLPGRLRSHL